MLHGYFIDAFLFSEQNPNNNKTGNISGSHAWVTATIQRYCEWLLAHCFVIASVVSGGW